MWNGVGLNYFYASRRRFLLSSFILFIILSGILVIANVVFGFISFNSSANEVDTSYIPTITIKRVLPTSGTDFKYNIKIVAKDLQTVAHKKANTLLACNTLSGYNVQSTFTTDDAATGTKYYNYNIDSNSQYICIKTTYKIQDGITIDTKIEKYYADHSSPHITLNQKEGEWAIEATSDEPVYLRSFLIDLTYQNCNFPNALEPWNETTTNNYRNQKMNKWTITNEVDNSNVNRWLCVQVKDDNYNYDAKAIQITKPVLKVIINPNRYGKPSTAAEPPANTLQLTASTNGDDNVDWQVKKSSSSTVCTNGSSVPNLTYLTSLTNTPHVRYRVQEPADNNKYFCFIATASDGRTAQESIQITPSLAPPDPVLDFAPISSSNPVTSNTSGCQIDQWTITGGPSTKTLATPPVPFTYEVPSTTSHSEKFIWYVNVDVPLEPTDPHYFPPGHPNHNPDATKTISQKREKTKTKTITSTVTRSAKFTPAYDTFELTQEDIKEIIKAVEFDADIQDTSSNLTIGPKNIKLKIQFEHKDLKTGNGVLATNPLPGHPAPGHPTTGRIVRGAQYELEISASPQIKRARNNLSTNIVSNSPLKKLSDLDTTILTGIDNNSYDYGLIESYEWNIDWKLKISQSSGINYTTYTASPNLSFNVPPDDTGTDLDNNRGTTTPSTATEEHTETTSFSGTYKTCSRTLLVVPPVCSIKLNNSRNYKTENFNPTTVGGTNNKDEIRVYAVGPNQRSQFSLRNLNNQFDLATDSIFHPTYKISAAPAGSAYSNASAYNADPNSPSGTQIASGDGIIIPDLAPTGDSSRSNKRWYTERSNSINYPGRYRVTWSNNWQFANKAKSIWNGPPLTSDKCIYEEDTSTEDVWGPQSRLPADGTLVDKLELDYWVYAEPPTCEINYALFEVNDPQTSAKLTISNPNGAPISIDVAEFALKRDGSATSYTGSASSTTVPSNGKKLIEGFHNPLITESGHFNTSWNIAASMGAERWSTRPNTTSFLNFTGLTQNSWFEDVNERIVPLDGSGICSKQNLRIIRRPYVKVFHGGLIAGGFFGESEKFRACGDNFSNIVGNNTDNLGYIAGHADNNGGTGFRGSSVQYELRGNKAINNFYSASQRTSADRPRGLTLSNTNISGLNAYGGNFNKPSCIGNYWRKTKEITSETPSPYEVDLSTLSDNDRKLYTPPTVGNKLVINPTAESNTQLKATVFVDGDIHIKNNIKNTQATVWSDPSEIDYITIIAKGNIYIDPSVEQIDALLVAYPNEDPNGEAVDGQIHTCWFDDIPMDKDSHFARCGNQLVINGALVAQKVVLGRIYGSVKSGSVSPNENSSNTEAAEVINFLPQYLIGVPELPIFPDQVYQSDSYTTRPINF